MKGGVLAHEFLDGVVAEELAVGESSVDVVDDEFKYFLLLGVLLQSGVVDVRIHHHVILLALAGERLLEVVLVGGQILEQKFPTHAAMFPLH